MILFGLRGQVPDSGVLLERVSALEKENKITIQLFRADRIFGALHMVSAVEKAQRSFSSGNSMAKTLGMEIMLYAAAERQTSEAIKKLGIFDGITELAMVVVGDAPDNLLDELELERDDSVLKPDGKDPAIFGIIPEETSGASIPDLVLEKVAISEVLR